MSTSGLNLENKIDTLLKNPDQVQPNEIQDNQVPKTKEIDFFKPRSNPIPQNDLFMKMRDSLVLKVLGNPKKDANA